MQSSTWLNAALWQRHCDERRAEDIERRKQTMIALLVLITFFAALTADHIVTRHPAEAR